MRGLLMDTCNNVVWEGLDDSELPDPKLSPPSGGDQLASVVITGDSSNIVFKDCDISPGAGDAYYGRSAPCLFLRAVT